MRYYVSHSIRGKYGKDATPTQMKENCDRIIAIANEIRANLPIIELYVPAEHEDFVQLAYNLGYLTEQQILKIDCHIIDNCDGGVLIFQPQDDPICGGRVVEWEHAIATSKPVLFFDTADRAIRWLTIQVMRG
jgi:nucleoside 2-deoxyribosyltransferase